MALSGRKAVTTAGTAVVLGTQQVAAPLAVKANTVNTGLIYIGNDGAGDVASTNGFSLAAGDVIIFEHVGHLGNIWIDSVVNGEGVSWLILAA
jgi:hypothetical protein